MFWILVALWWIIGIITSGFEIAYYQRRFYSLASAYYWQDITIALFLSTAGPISLILYFMAMGTQGFRYGWTFKPYKGGKPWIPGQENF